MQKLKTILSVLVFGTFLAIGFLLDLLHQYYNQIAFGPDASDISGLIANSIYVLAIGAVIIWNVDWESVDPTAWTIIRSIVALAAYAMAYVFDGLTFMGTPLWAFPSLAWIFTYFAPAMLVLDLGLAIWIYKKKS